MSQRKNKTISECVKEILIKNDFPGVLWGDCWLLDEAANLATHTNLMTLHPMSSNCHTKMNFVRGYAVLVGWMEFYRCPKCGHKYHRVKKE